MLGESYEMWNTRYLVGSGKESTGDLSFRDKQNSKISSELEHKTTKNRLMVQNKRRKKKVKNSKQDWCLYLTREKE